MLANEKVKLNDTIGRNQYLKTEINIMSQVAVIMKLLIIKDN